MYRFIVALLAFAILATTLACNDRMALAEASFGKMNDPNSKASPFSVISMGRDDDDGKAKKWHIGGRD